MEGAAGNKRLSSSTACAGSTNVLVYQKLCCRARSVGLLNCHPGIAQASGKKHDVATRLSTSSTVSSFAGTAQLGNATART
jgi:hypothetical protein